MLLDPMGGIVMTNDGNAILREVRFLHYISHQHPYTALEDGECKQIQVCSSYLSYKQTQIQVQHPAAKSMIEISRTQDEEVGDGTTSVIILGEWPGSGSISFHWDPVNLFNIVNVPF